MAVYYAVRNGRHIGIYDNWGKAKKEVDKYNGADYKKFDNVNDAFKYVSSNMLNLSEISDKDRKDVISFVNHKKKEQKALSDKKTCRAYIDGAYNFDTNIYGCGGILICDEGTYLIEEKGSNGASLDQIQSARYKAIRKECVN